jgi:hypothetical protein
MNYERQHISLHSGFNVNDFVVTQKPSAEKLLNLLALQIKRYRPGVDK